MADDPTAPVPFARIDDRSPTEESARPAPDDAGAPAMPPLMGSSGAVVAPFSVPPPSPGVAAAPASRSLSRWTWASIGLGVVALFVGVVILTTSDFSGPPLVSTAPIGTVVAPTDGVAFTDPQGSYTIDLAPGWDRLSGSPVKEVEAWGVAVDSGGLTPNVTLLTQDSQGMDLAKYMDASVQSLGEGHLDYSTTVTGVHGNQLGVIEYHGLVGAPAKALHFLAVFDVRDGQAVVATLTTTDARFPALRAEAEPYLRTLQAT